MVILRPVSPRSNTALAVFFIGRDPTRVHPNPLVPSSANGSAHRLMGVPIGVTWFGDGTDATDRRLDPCQVHKECGPVALLCGCRH